MKHPQAELNDEPIHEWFELSYANYLVLPRAILQSAPPDLQRRLRTCLEELHEMFGDIPEDGAYRVSLRSDSGRFMRDGLADYERGRRRIVGKIPTKS